jgi:hypothetical protein
MAAVAVTVAVVWDTPPQDEETPNEVCGQASILAQIVLDQYDKSLFIGCSLPQIIDVANEITDTEKLDRVCVHVYAHDWARFESESDKDKGEFGEICPLLTCKPHEILEVIASKDPLTVELFHVCKADDIIFVLGNIHVDERDRVCSHVYKHDTDKLKDEKDKLNQCFVRVCPPQTCDTTAITNEFIGDRLRDKNLFRYCKPSEILTVLEGCKTHDDCDSQRACDHVSTHNQVTLEGRKEIDDICLSPSYMDMFDGFGDVVDVVETVGFLVNLYDSIVFLFCRILPVI